MDFRPHAHMASRTREYLHDVYSQLLSDPQDLYRVTMTAHELIENLIKYSADGPGSIEVQLERDADQEYLTVSTRNRATHQRAARLTALVQRIASSENPMTIYDAMIRETADAEGSGLGLARIRAEAGMELGCSTENEYVVISARAPVNVTGKLCH